jgi:hypothetical protein
MDCPRCGLINPATASRCDCGYDFQTRTIERPFYQQKLPRDIKRFLVLIVVLNAISAAVVLASGDPTRLLFVLIWSAAIWLTYSRLVQGKNWARFVLGILTFPLGLLVVLSRETKLYCLQRGMK